MKADGTVLIDTKILDDGLEKGFEAIKEDMSTIGITAKKVGDQVALSFSKFDVSKPIANAVTKIEEMENRLAGKTRLLDAWGKVGSTPANSEAAAKLEEERYKLTDKLAAAREKLAFDLNYAIEKQAKVAEKAAQREAAAAEKAAQREAAAAEKAAERKAAAEEKAAERSRKAAEKEAAAKKKATEKQFNDLKKPARQFNSRLREIASGALVFNLISSGLRAVTSYFGTALMANDDFSRSVGELKGALMTAFQPIYSVAAPALTYLVQMATYAVNALSVLFATLTGTDTRQNAEAAKALYEKAGAINAVGGAAKKASRSLAAFDEINTLSNNNETGGGGAGGSVMPDFSAISMLPENLETKIKSLGVTISEIFFNWDEITPENLAMKIMTGLISIAGLVAGFTIGGVPGAIVGTLAGLALGVILSNISFDKDGKLSTKEITTIFLGALNAALGGVVGFYLGGPTGAAIGAILGIGLTVGFSEIVFSESFQKNMTEFGEKLQEKVRKTFGESVYESLFVFDGLQIEIDIDPNTINIAEGITKIINAMITNMNKNLQEIFVNWNRGIQKLRNIKILGGYPFSSMQPIMPIPQIPYLAQGAVIPPNAPFMAVLGDQRNGTNIEAPLSTIQEAVALVMEDYIASNLAGHEATVGVLREILEAMLGIRIGDDVIGRAVQRYNTKMAVMKGG